MDNFESRTIALAGIFRTAALVNILANQGTISEDDLRISVESVFKQIQIMLLRSLEILLTFRLALRL